MSGLFHFACFRGVPICSTLPEYHSLIDKHNLWNMFGDSLHFSLFLSSLPLITSQSPAEWKTMSVAPVYYSWPSYFIFYCWILICIWKNINRSFKQPYIAYSFCFESYYPFISTTIIIVFIKNNNANVLMLLNFNFSITIKNAPSTLMLYP